MGIFDTDDDDDLDEVPAQDNSAIRQLRKALKAEQARNKELSAQMESLAKFQRERTVADVLSSKGLRNPAKVARLIPSDIGSDPDTLSKWLEEYSDVFGLSAAEDAAPAVPNETVASLRAMDAAGAAAPELTGAAAIEQAIRNATSPEELAQVLARFGSAG